MLDPIRVMARPPAGEIPDRSEDFLRSLGGPTWIECPGRVAGPPRVVVTLLHGNEPSGLRAVQTWLRAGEPPAVDTVLVVASVKTALTPPSFSHRRLPGQPDANRCFRPPFLGEVGRTAEELLQRLRRLAPQALIDLHNTTGANPAYGVGVQVDAPSLALTSLFAPRYMHSDLTMNALMEVGAEICPTVTIECGRAGDPLADEIARAGLSRFLGAPSLRLHEGASEPVEVLEQPHRVVIRPEVDLRFGPAPTDLPMLTIDPALESYNFRTLPAGTRVGWFSGPEIPLEAQGAEGTDRAGELFELRGGVLRTARSMVPVMVTLDPVIARQDCLFYAMLGARGWRPATA